ncbi:putative gibberellin 20-oxidase [Periconia macrospinosa]|uniref:Putative gibberellin 20-oxidase n=1 Tax=Periconia macrospinosa TaxID=97972 RepID=A0A2V1DAA0_9PLEO|nr:putative gibberellin 20-oxidase [Periconia macrospinosa]
MDLPTLDFSKYLLGTPREKQQLGEALIDSFVKHGFVKLINHGIPEDIVNRYQAATKELFALPLEQKQAFENEKGPKPQRGWSSKGAEVTAKLRKSNIPPGSTGDELKDEREFFDAGPPSDTQFPNKWPTSSLPTFQPTMEECYTCLQYTSLHILNAMERGLHLPANSLTHRCQPSASEIRLNHYPSVSITLLNAGKIKRTHPHTDFGIITLLFQDHVGGLELEDRSRPGTFAPVVPQAEGEPSALVVNISDTFERWSNGVVRAGVHRVDVPPGMKGLESGVCPPRHSSVFFFKATRETSVGPLPEFVTKERPAIFEEMTALEFQRRKTEVLY